MAANRSRLLVHMCRVVRRWESYPQLFRRDLRSIVSVPPRRHTCFLRPTGLKSRPLVTSSHRYAQSGSADQESGGKPKPKVGLIKRVALKTHNGTIWLLNKISPRACVFYVRFVDGMTSFVQDFRYVYSMNKRLRNKEIRLEDLEWRDLYRKMQMKQDVARVLPTLAVVNIPFVFYVALPVVLYFQRIFLSDHFLAPEDVAANHEEHHKKRRALYPLILKCLDKRLTKPPTTEGTDSLRARLGQLEEEPPSSSQLLSYRPVFGQQAALKSLSRGHLKHLCRLHSQWVLFAPSRTLRRRLMDHAALLSAMDRAVMSSDVDQIDDLDLRKLCNQRGFNPVGSESAAIRQWLKEWCCVSEALNDEERSLLLHASILLVAGQPNQGEASVGNQV